MLIKTSTHLGTGNIVLDQLIDKMDVIAPSCETVCGLIHVGACTLDNEAAISPQNVVELQVRGFLAARTDME